MGNTHPGQPGTRSRLRPVQGFTLVELLVAMSILIVVTTSTTLIFRGITRAWRSGELRTERYQQARLLFDLFTRELSSCVAGERYPLVGIDAGQAAIKAGSRHDQLFFVGALPGRTGLVERGYWVNDRDQLMCHDEEPADGDLASGADELCGTDIGSFDVTFFDGAQWLTAWDGRADAAQAGRIPKALHIVMVIGHPQPEPFETIVYLPASESRWRRPSVVARLAWIPPMPALARIAD